MTHIEGLTAGSDSDCRMVEGGDESPPKPFYGAYDIRDLSGQACGDEGGGRGITSVTAAHLSARFPLISPTGAVSCAGNDAVPPRFVFDADGGYLENSGLQAIAQAYTEIEPLISKNNATPDIRRVVPYVVLLENSSQAPTVSPSSERLHEVPAVANGKSISQPLTQDLLREELAVALYRQGSPGNAVPQVQVWSPPDFPSVSAPLGWTLSAASRVSLYDRMISLCEKDKGVVAMREFLSGSAEAPNCEESLVNTG
jgi:hypothetical protein